MNIIIESVITPVEVFNNLKNGGLKLICENLENNTLTEVSWFPGGKIELITISKNNGHYFNDFNYENAISLMKNTIFFKNKKWYIGHIDN